jgi:hypothetical protein
MRMIYEVFCMDHGHVPYCQFVVGRTAPHEMIPEKIHEQSLPVFQVTVPQMRCYLQLFA